jgi:hypothetical protein
MKAWSTGPTGIYQPSRLTSQCYIYHNM